MAEDLNIKFGADTSSLEKGADRVQAEVSQLRVDMEGLKRVVQETAFAMTGTLVQAMDRTSKAADEVDRQVDKVGKQSGVLDGALRKLAVTLGTVFSIRAVVGFARDIDETVERFENLSQSVGISISDLSAWEAVTKKSGITTDEFGAGIVRLVRAQENARDGNNQLRQAFRELGIDVSVARTNQELLITVSEQFSKLPDGPRKTALAVELLGRSGANLIPVFNRGAEAITKTMDDAKASGEALSEELVQNGLAIGDAFDRLNATITSVRNALATALGPAIVAVIDYMTRLVGAAKDAGSSTEASGRSLEAFGDVLKVVITALGLFITALQAAWSILQAVAQAVVSVGIGLFEFAQRLASGDLAGAAEVFKNRMSQAISLIKDDIDSAANAQRNFNQLVEDLWRSADARKGQSPLGDAQEERLAPGGGAPRVTEEQVKQQLEALKTQQEAVKDDYEQWVRLQEERLRIVGEFYGRESEEFQKLLTEKAARSAQHEQELTQIARSGAQARASILLSQAQADEAIAQIRFNAELDAIERAEQRGQISAERAVALRGQVLAQQQQLEADSANRVFQIQLDLLNKQLQLEDLRPRERERILQQIEVLEAQHAARMAEMQATQAAAVQEVQRDSADAVYEKWNSILEPIGQSFNSAFQSIYNGQETFKGAMLKVLDEILFNFVQMGINMVVQWATNQLAMTAATTAGATTRTAVETTAATTSAAASSGFALIDIANAAVRAAAGAYAAIAGIPVVGPFLAPVLAAGALAAVIGFGSGIISARGGLDRVEKDGQLAELHKDEMVLPANIASPLRDAIGGFTIAQSSRDTVNQAASAGEVLRTDNSRSSEINLTYGPTVNSEASGLEGLLRRDAQTLRKWLRNEARNGRISL